jgi:hypothetical protein
MQRIDQTNRWGSQAGQRLSDPSPPPFELVPSLGAGATSPSSGRRPYPPRSAKDSTVTPPEQKDGVIATAAIVGSVLTGVAIVASLAATFFAATRATFFAATRALNREDDDTAADPNSAGPPRRPQFPVAPRPGPTSRQNSPRRNRKTGLTPGQPRGY